MVSFLDLPIHTSLHRDSKTLLINNGDKNHKSASSSSGNGIAAAWSISACQPQEWLLEVVVGLGGNVKVLQVLLSVESDGLGLDFSFLDIDFVTTQDNWDVFTHSDQVSVPVRNVLVGDSGGDVEHDDTTLTVDVVTVSQSTEFFLSSSVPDVELDLTEVGVERHWVDLNTGGGHVFFLKLSSQVSLDESGLNVSCL
ncbi:hypothetical protein OGAPHI_007179 [Ogataea philodendri]|uniref:Uncharacterized protein n=1 Tax=Ogataea philodendri TaxID=1378263 RepID=A0A9P8SZD1_9ASCO|nr:uncharacterized protein OGAPHI_007179 [Ogataea philodendri]KAH3659974.1 hypothetical protein OGAPHI_007179 [Ogataea philodendri]